MKEARAEHDRCVALNREAEEKAAKGGTSKDASKVAAFFDLDGTLIPLPSLEKRLWTILRSQRAIGVRNYCFWLREALRLAPRGVNQILYGNKVYLREISVDWLDRVIFPGFFTEGIDRVLWHAERGHSIVIVSGTIEQFALRAARSQELQLALRGIRTSVEVCATALKSLEEKWTGRISGEAMFGKEKVRAMWKYAALRGLELEECFAYGDSAHDRRMLEAVGQPHAVNPSNDLARIAGRNGWPVLHWNRTSRGGSRSLHGWEKRHEYVGDGGQKRASIG